MIETDNGERIRALNSRIYYKMKTICERSKNKIPYTSINGVHDDKSSNNDGLNQGDGINWWTNGFWGGILWLMYNKTKDQKYIEMARISEDKLDQCFKEYYGLHHDVGFMWLPTAVADYRLTNNPESRKRGLHAANILAGRYNPAGGFIRAWNERTFGDEDTTGWAIIDCMMNLPLLYWASKEIKDPRYHFIAMGHADKVMDSFIREDGSVCHIVEFDPTTGERVRDYRGQGYAQGSAWTRGQCWAIYGFALSYHYTGKEEYLQTARKVADYFVNNIPENGRIPVDYNQPIESDLVDDSAAAIASSALLFLAELVSEEEQKEYVQIAEKLIFTLEQTSCNWSEEVDNLLENCTAAYHDEQHHFPIIYGDYYFMEAVARLSGSQFLMW